MTTICHLLQGHPHERGLHRQGSQMPTETLLCLRMKQTFYENHLLLQRLCAAGGKKDFITATFLSVYNTFNFLLLILMYDKQYPS